MRRPVQRRISPGFPVPNCGSEALIRARQAAALFALSLPSVAAGLQFTLMQEGIRSLTFVLANLRILPASPLTLRVCEVSSSHYPAPEGASQASPARKGWVSFATTAKSAVGAAHPYRQPIRTLSSLERLRPDPTDARHSI
jgi:hypothetical protein